MSRVIREPTLHKTTLIRINVKNPIIYLITIECIVKQ